MHNGQQAFSAFQRTAARYRAFLQIIWYRRKEGTVKEANSKMVKNSTDSIDRFVGIKYNNAMKYELLYGQ